MNKKLIYLFLVVVLVSCTPAATPVAERSSQVEIRPTNTAVRSSSSKSVSPSIKEEFLYIAIDEFINQYPKETVALKKQLPHIVIDVSGYKVTYTHQDHKFLLSTLSADEELMMVGQLFALTAQVSDGFSFNFDGLKFVAHSDEVPDRILYVDGKENIQRIASNPDLVFDFMKNDVDLNVKSPEINISKCPNGCTVPPAGCVIKANISVDTGEKIYHVPGQKYYTQTKINPEYGERWFCTEQEAINNGWRKSRE